jgi:FtsP/CotA-like multicopper oxidase with cupredoxin domain
VIDPAGKDPITYDKDYVVMLSDWTDENPTDVYHKYRHF